MRRYERQRRKVAIETVCPGLRNRSVSMDDLKAPRGHDDLPRQSMIPRDTLPMSRLR